MPDPVRVLLNLRGGYGLGDTVQFSVVLKHLQKYRPHWIVDVSSPRGMHSALHGLCNVSWPDEAPAKGYDKVMDLELWEAFKHYSDRPCNKTTYFLPLVFGIDYDASLGRYQVKVSEEAMNKAAKWLRTVAKQEGEKFRAVVLHYRGGSHGAAKNLEHWQAEEVIKAIGQMGRVPLLLDRERQTDGHCRIPEPLSSDAEVLAAIIRQCEAFVGIDSGPGKIASSTDTPSLLCWIKHHPLRYHDPADNTMHLIPHNWRLMVPVEGDAERADYFAANYNFTPYRGQHGLIGGVGVWLSVVLRETWEDPGVSFVVPPGEESARWVLAKLWGLAAGRPIDVIVSAERCSENRTPGVDLYQARGWIRSVRCLPIPVHLGAEKPQNTRGHYLYVSDGYRGGYHYLVPLAVIQQGGALADWMPEVAVDERTP